MVLGNARGIMKKSTGSLVERIAGFQKSLVVKLEEKHGAAKQDLSVPERIQEML